VAEENTRHQMVTAGEPLLYDKPMTRIFLADSQSTERLALRLLIIDFKMEVVGEAADWFTTITQVPNLRTDLLLLDWGLLPNNPGVALQGFREACPAVQVIVLINHPDARYQAAISAGGYAFITKDETPDRFVERLRTAAASLPPDR
jgi:DNA-binding NarL/FixJ family response regulator